MSPWLMGAFQKASKLMKCSGNYIIGDHMKEIVFESATPEADCGLVDGPCMLPEGMAWPQDAESLPLFHLMSVPASWLIRDCGGSSLNKWISIFVSYDKSGYSHYGKMSSDEPNHSEAEVILHDMSGPRRSEHPAQAIDSKNVRLVPANEGDENVASYIESEPYWVQDPISLEGFQWAMSIYGPDMDVALGANRGILSDGVGYVFLEEDANVNSYGSIGKFFFQL